ncbi:MAG: hypothetical protein U5N26_10595 [Candidatus Marinimicrobia bacterium]|nr:hypothetical protein [Candidatus Neomarinimicrobiota bacterium]
MLRIPGLSKIWEQSGPQLAYGQIVAWGQYAVGIGISVIFIAPVFGLPDFFGVIIPVGFEGAAEAGRSLSRQKKKRDVFVKRKVRLEWRESAFSSGRSHSFRRPGNAGHFPRRAR